MSWIVETVGELSTFGQVLRRHRRNKSLSLRQLAEHVHYSKGYLSKIETGTKQPSRDLARLCDGVLEADGELMALLPRATPAAAAGTTRGERSEGAQLGCVGPRRACEMHRAEEVVSPLQGISAPALTVVAGDEDTVVQLGEFLRLLQAWGQNRPPAMTVPTLLVQVDLIAKLARAAGPAQRAPLLGMASRFADYTGWLVQEAGDDAAMTQWTQRSVNWAEAAGDEALAAHGDVRHANVAMYRDDAVSAIEFSRRAVHRLDAAGGGNVVAQTRVRALALYRMAQGFALLGQRSRCLATIQEARHLAAPGVDDARTHEERYGRGRVHAVGPWTVSDPGDLVEGWCLHDLGLVEQSIPLLQRHLARTPVTARRARARTIGRLALSHAAITDIPTASALAHTALDDAAHVDSATLRHDLRRLLVLLARRPADSWSEDLGVRLAHALTVTVPAVPR